MIKDYIIAIAGVGYVRLSIATLLSQYHKVTGVPKTTMLQISTLIHLQ